MNKFYRNFWNRVAIVGTALIGIGVLVIVANNIGILN